MKVKVGNNLYSMSTGEYRGLLKTASEQVPFGIYAVERNGYAELRNDRCTSMSQLKNLTRQYRAAGFNVKSSKDK